MKDLTSSSIVKNILQMALPIVASMFFQTLYFLIDLYFVAGLGDAAIAGVGAAGNVMFIVFAATQVLGVGTVTLISHAAGRKDQADANLVFNQSLSLAGICALVTLALGFIAGPYYVRSLGASAATAAAGVEYLHWFPAESGAAVRGGDDGIGAAGYRNRAADDDCASTDGAIECPTRAGVDCRVGHRSSHGRGRCGIGKFARFGRRFHHAGVLLSAPGKVCGI